MSSFRSATVVAICLAAPACGGTTQPGTYSDASVVDASNDVAIDTLARDEGQSDAVADAVQACFDDAGTMPTSAFKTCHADGDCTYFTHQTDCCGDTTLTGVSKSALAHVVTCETLWDKHFPACGCAEGPPKTEDGKTTTFGAMPTVKCGDFTMSGGICLTSTP
jgi:hypothetical protein